MLRFALLAVCLVLGPLSGVLADTSSGSQVSPVLLVTPGVASGSIQRDLIGHNLPASAPAPVVLFAPDASETAMAAHTDPSGNLDIPLTPARGFAAPGIYRAVLDLGSSQSISALFAVGDSTPLLQAEPEIFSPYSALQVLGAGLPANQAFDLILTPANDRGDHILAVSTDASGFLQAFIWPDELGESFFEAGAYRATIPALHLAVTFQVREKPIGAVVEVDGPAPSGVPVPIHFRRYEPGRYLWAVYADAAGRVQGEMLFGVTDLSGSLDTTASFSNLGGGQYRLATPYDWGETTFTALPPTPTPTATPTPTWTPTATPTPTASPTPPPVKFKKVCKRRHGKKKCKRVRVVPQP